MNNDPQSNLPMATQPDLLPSSEMDNALFSDSEAKGQFTGERLAKFHPEKYQAILNLLGEGCGVRFISKLVKVSPHTVQAVRSREPSAIATLKEKMADGFRGIAALCQEGIRDILTDKDVKFDKKDLKGLAVTMGISVEKFQLLDGQATHRYESTLSEPGHGGYAAMLRELKAEAERMGIVGEKTAQKRIVPIDVGELEDTQENGVNVA